jgi:hypothetical protein
MLLPVLEWLALRGRKAGYSGVWTGIALAAFLLRWHHRHEAKRSVVLREALGPGETLTISHTNLPRG